ncbi:hypothetical protein [Leifsonia sp. fls2-241-R2A-40a]|uniref:hypothetical protein n=1 Tax=Leifsonia sp. fls2-241-R2A-40a TaxID=3040290 RepID=UPI00254DCA17|nr:hypothetical protein [Leifsonia sp. fls2-241-R2A-40a]
MTDVRVHGTETAASVATFSAKLPDDLLLTEFADLTESVQVLAASANKGLESESPTFVQRVQYGSEFLIIVGIVTAVVAPFLTFSKGLDFLASAGLKNEERLGKRQERLARKREIKVAEARLIAERRKARDAKVDPTGAPAVRRQYDRIMPEQQRDELAVVIGREAAQNPRVLTALATLAEYGIDIRVRRE